MDFLIDDEWTRLAAHVASLLQASDSVASLQAIRRHLGTSDPVVLHNVLITLEFDYPQLQFCGSRFSGDPAAARRANVGAASAAIPRQRAGPM